MTIERVLADTFAAHEDLAPDGDDVLAAVRSRVHSRRSVARPLAIAATVAVLTAGVGVAAVVAQGSDGRATQPAAASPSPSVPTSSPSSSPSSVPSSSAPTELAMPFSVGWLPAGAVAYVSRRTSVVGLIGGGPIAVNGEYLLTVTSGTQVLDVDVAEVVGGLGGETFKSGPGAATTVAGRDGIESSVATGPVGYEVYFVAPGGRTMYVNVLDDPAGTPTPAGELLTVGREIAASITVPGTTLVAATFGVGHVPAGMRVRGFEVAAALDADGTDPTAPPTTSYDIGRSTQQDPAVSVSTGSALTTPGTTPGRPVRGHPTSYTDDGGYLTLVVSDAVQGQPVVIAGGLPLDELYAVADGLVLPG